MDPQTLVSSNNNDKQNINKEKIVNINTTDASTLSDTTDKIKLNVTDWELYDSWTFLGEPKSTSTTLSTSSNSATLDTGISTNSSNSEDIIKESKHAEEIIHTINDNTGSESDCGSDGISVISDVDDYNSSYKNQIEENITKDISYELETSPIATDITEQNYHNSLKLSEIERRNSTNEYVNHTKSLISSRSIYLSPGNLVLFGVLAGVTGIALGHIFKISRNDASILDHISPLVKRIRELEQENNLLKTELKWFHDKRNEEKLDLNKNIVEFPKPLAYYVENIIKNRKQVWTGDSMTDAPSIIQDYKLQIPEFCRHPDISDDLFAERYSQICEKQEQKLSKLIQKLNYNNRKKLVRIKSHFATGQRTSDNQKNYNSELNTSSIEHVNDDSSINISSDEVTTFNTEAEVADDERSSNSSEELKREKVVVEKGAKFENNSQRREPLKRQNNFEQNLDSNKIYSNTQQKNNNKKNGMNRNKNITSSDSNKKTKENSRSKLEKNKENLKFKENKSTSPIRESVEKREKLREERQKNWLEKRKLGREEIRTKNAAENNKRNWYLERSNDREHQRDSKDYTRNIKKN